MVWYDGKNTVIGSVIYPFFIITGVISVFNIAVQLIEKGVVKSHSILTQSTFFIFALHTLLVLRISSYTINAIIGGGQCVCYDFVIYINTIIGYRNMFVIVYCN